MLQTVLLASAVLVAVNGDCYLHTCRGSNNRLNEQSANRNNANRLFDSQNNNRGGYNVCDLDVEEGFSATEWMASATQMYDWTFLYEAGQSNDAYRKQYEEVYFVQSNLSLTWTNQHGAGNKKLLSQMILQYGCDTFPRPYPSGSSLAQSYGPETVLNTMGSSVCDSACKNRLLEMRKHGLRMELMNGGNTNTPDDAQNVNDIGTRYNTNNDDNEGRHESEEYYHLCETRRQNTGLFHADQDLAGATQKYTRQNNAGTRRGLECPEERDYYPWWNPSPWHDIAIITPDVEYCRQHQAPESQNVKAKCSCSNPGASLASGTASSWFPESDYVQYNLNQTDCEANGGEWSCFQWNGEEPECVESYWSKVNHLGNVDGTTRGGKQAHYDWKLPSWSELTEDHSCWPYEYSINQVYPTLPQADAASTISCVRMVSRIRYNISTMDYDPYKTNSTHDYDPQGGILSPIEENPEVDVGLYVQGLQLAINTAQTGRTFQDRSHTFLVCQRDSTSVFAQREIINVNVRGKRGNIVQTFPATEYDFEPQHIELLPSSGSCLHFQWCGSNTHNNGAPGGDGQTGDDGQGRGGSDRSNLCQMKQMDQSYPVPYDQMDELYTTDGTKVESFFDYVTCYHPFNPQVEVSAEDAQLILCTGGFYKGYEYMLRQCADITTYDNGENRGDCIVDEVLNNVSGAFRAGLICCLKDGLTNADFEEDKSFAFLSTRNNNFSNRSQKLKIVLSATPDSPLLW
eukprot:CAMPEP_0202695168 /NCGR_PEP_ID=MMETSP1385-20130828/8826_1 /ASSEMBLY_ACC=CAM_ASM_000861 /TAXON_ID=933848 /ORGANISM="Elphidium margaritaceum" /LENGTH=741 /DNA_ID=CAMNT_0049351143 /DNA_START=90 /DNA_END=2315 /DNA_ORIENTATION=+